MPLFVDGVLEPVKHVEGAHDLGASLDG